MIRFAPRAVVSLLAAILLVGPAAGSHGDDRDDVPLSEQTWHVQLLAYAPGVDLFLLVQLPSARDASAALSEGRAPEPTVEADHAVAPDDVVPEAKAALAAAPGRMAAEGADAVAFATAIVSPSDVDALAAALAGPSPGADVEAFVQGKLHVLRGAGAMPQDNTLSCWIVCVATDADDCPANGLPP